MSIPYLTIKRSLALRLAQIIGSSQGTLQTAYEGTWASMLDGAEIPRLAFRDQVLFIERELVQMIGNNAQHPARSQLYSPSASLSDLDATPSTDADGNEFFGVFDSCADSTSKRPLTWVPTQTVADIMDGGSDFFGDTDFYYYNINGNFIRCTRPSVILQGVSWSYDDAVTAYDADGDSPLPQGLAPVWIDGVTARAAQVGWVDGNNAFSYYNGLYQTGKTDFNSLAGTPNVPLASQNQISG